MAILYGCEPMDTIPKASSIEEAELAPVVKEEAGKTVAAISSDYTKPQKLNANDSSELGQANAVFRPGALATQSEVSMEEGSDIVDADAKKRLGLEEDYVPYSRPLNISSSSEIDGAVPLSIALEMNENLSLATGMGKVFIVIYILETKLGPKLGVIPTTDITINELIASFDFTTEGTYHKVSFQLAAFEFSGALFKEVESSRSVRPKFESIGEPNVEETAKEQLTTEKTCQKIDPAKIESGTEICGLSGTLDLSNLKAEYIANGKSIAGVSGNLLAGSYEDCKTDGQKNCVSNTSFPAADSDSLAAKIVSGQSVAGIEGSTTNVVYNVCTGANQEGCVASSTYKTMDLSAKDSSGALDLNNSTFSTRMTSGTPFEYWDENGIRHTNTGDADITAANVRSGIELFGVTGTAVPSPDCASIAVGGTWILVPGDSDYGTNDFCVMKYEAKCSEADGANCTANMSAESPSSTVANTPWISISQQDANTECASLGKGFHLITNDEWMTIGANVANVDSNWDGGAVGLSELARGHSDDDPSEACAANADDTKAYVETNCAGAASGDDFRERRTLTLTNGEVIWDLAGNVWEWTAYFNDEEKPSDDGTPENSWEDYSLPLIGTATMPVSDLIPTNTVKSYWDDTWDLNESIGRFNPYPDGSGGALRRGGNWDNSSISGVFAANMGSVATAALVNGGFRCAVAVP